jgi:AcrR family transcriptional regulator
MSRPRGRPRTFNEGHVLDALLDTFWARGFGGASLDDLAAAAGVKRQSLYLAFGDKEAMYLKAMARFVGRLEAAFVRSFAPGRPLAEGLRDVYLRSLEAYLSGDAGPRVLCTAPVAAPTAPAVRAALAEVLGRVDVAFARRFRAAAAAGEVAALPSPAARARLAAAALHSLAVRARAGVARVDLEAFVNDTVATLAPPPPPCGAAPPGAAGGSAVGAVEAGREGPRGGSARPGPGGRVRGRARHHRPTDRPKKKYARRASA